MSTSLFGDLPAVDTPEASTGAAYRVLARKYRPQNFAQLIGQEALVRTLTNAFKSNRIAHAFMLTGVRGIGKTTTARIIAKGLNCVGPDGAGGPTVEPCGVCDNCIAIAADRHVDVVEMDAASHNSVEDIRELTDGARYAPALGRYKVYIIDEVHMLSKAAFNALLKTLEEPPPHVKFVLATTEIRKVPVTILSRCQRFDLRRVDADILQAHFAKILGLENESAEDEALMLIARAADGSVRDGLSLLDQAIARADGEKISANLVRDMLGLADRTVVFDLLEALLNGQAAPALTILEDLHKAGADPATVLQDLLTLVHNVTRLKLAPASAEDLTQPEAERVRGRALAVGLTMPILTRAWNILLKGLGEVNAAPHPKQALEMVALRLVYTADLPSPGELVKQLQGGGIPSQSSSPSGSRAPSSSGGGGAAHAMATQVLQQPSDAAHPMPVSFQAMVELFRAERELVLAGHLFNAVHPVRFEPGHFEFRAAPTAPATLAATVGKKLSEWTGQRWMVSISNAPGGKTLAEEEVAARDEAMITAAANPAVKALLLAFPGARLTGVRELAPEVEISSGSEDVWLEE
jgi:DNA polymerase-3 subunit gamma/tau